MNRNQSIRRIAVAVLACAFAVVAAASAQADTGIRPDDRTTHGPGAVAAGAPSKPVRPDDRADRAIAPAAQPAAVRPDDRADRGLPTIAAEALPTTDGFDWTDAGIGAVGALGLVLLVASASLLGLRLRRVPVLS
jgi:hypothetical protein